VARTEYSRFFCSSRKKFTPPDHWLVTTEIDVQLFVQAALFEADKLEGEDVPTTHPPPRTAAKSMKRQAAAYGPRLGVLNNIPFAVPFEVRVAVFRGWVSKDMRIHAGRKLFTDIPWALS
jgi:ubiquitin-protein ligase E3 C